MLFEEEWHFFRNVWKPLRLIPLGAQSNNFQTIFLREKTTSTNLLMTMRCCIDTMVMWLKAIGKNKQHICFTDSISEKQRYVDFNATTFHRKISRTIPIFTDMFLQTSSCIFIFIPRGSQYETMRNPLIPVEETTFGWQFFIVYT